MKREEASQNGSGRLGQDKSKVGAQSPQDESAYLASRMREK
jgi:hypothetical protein